MCTHMLILCTAICMSEFCADNPTGPAGCGKLRRPKQSRGTAGWYWEPVDIRFEHCSKLRLVDFESTSDGSKSWKNHEDLRIWVIQLIKDGWFMMSSGTILANTHIILLANIRLQSGESLRTYVSCSWPLKRVGNAIKVGSNLRDAYTEPQWKSHEIEMYPTWSTATSLWEITIFFMGKLKALLTQDISTGPCSIANCHKWPEGFHY